MSVPSLYWLFPYCNISIPSLCLLKVHLSVLVLLCSFSCISFRTDVATVYCTYCIRTVPACGTILHFSGCRYPYISSYTCCTGISASSYSLLVPVPFTTVRYLGKIMYDILTWTHGIRCCVAVPLFCGSGSGYKLKF